MKDKKTVFKSLFSLMVILVAVFGCAGKKAQPTDNFGVQVNYPVFEGSRDFFQSFGVVWKIMSKGEYDGHKVEKPFTEDGWITPAFRESLCLVVTINNHCVG